MGAYARALEKILSSAEWASRMNDKDKILRFEIINLYKGLPLT